MFINITIISSRLLVNFFKITILHYLLFNNRSCFYFCYHKYDIVFAIVIIEESNNKVGIIVFI